MIAQGAHSTSLQMMPSWGSCEEQAILLLQESGLPFRGTMTTGTVGQQETCEAQVVWRRVWTGKNPKFACTVVDSELQPL